MPAHYPHRKRPPQPQEQTKKPPSKPIFKTNLHFVNDVVGTQHIVLLVQVTNGVFLCPEGLACTGEANHHDDLQAKYATLTYM